MNRYNSENKETIKAAEDPKKRPMANLNTSKAIKSNPRPISLISVVVPVYNVEPYIAQCIQSILNQKDENFEIIVVNDGTPDKSAEIAQSYADNYSNVFVYHQENQGISAARNLGIQKSRGDRILFVDSDDYLLAGILRQYREVEAVENPDVFVMNHRRQNKTAYEAKESIDALVKDRNTIIKYMLIYSGVEFYVWNKIVKRELLTTDQFPVGKIYEDVNGTYDFMLRAESVYFTSTIGYAYVENKESIVASPFNAQQYDFVTETLKLHQKMNVDLPSNRDLMIRKLGLSLVATGHKISLSLHTEQRVVAKHYLKRLRKAIRKNFRYLMRLTRVDILIMARLMLQLTNIHLYGVVWNVWLRFKKTQQS